MFASKSDTESHFQKKSCISVSHFSWTKMMEMQVFRFSGWWFQPIWKIFVKMGSSSPNRDENKTYLKPPPSFSCLVHEKNQAFLLLPLFHPVSIRRPSFSSSPAELPAESPSTPRELSASNGRTKLAQNFVVLGYWRGYTCYNDLVGGWTNPLEKY